MKRIKLFIAGILLVVILMTGCEQKIVITTGFDEGEVIKLSGNGVQLSEAMILLLSEKESYDAGLDEKFWNIEYKDKTMISYFKEEIKDEFIRLNVLSEFAKSKNVSLSEEEETHIKAKAKQYMENADTEVVEQYDITEKNVISLMKKIVLSEKVYEKVINDYDVEISDEEARVMYVNYIVLEADVDKAMDVAGEIYGKVTLGADFSTVADRYDYATYNEGYVSRDDFGEEQSEQIFKLKDSQVSSIIEDNGKIYIIKCVNDYDETMTNSNKNILVSQKKEEEFNKEYRPYEISVNVEFNTKLWDEIKLTDSQKKIGVNVYNILEEAEQQ